jgi:hypothetical protein
MGSRRVTGIVELHDVYTFADHRPNRPSELIRAIADYTHSRDIAAQLTLIGQAASDCVLTGACPHARPGMLPALISLRITMSRRGFAAAAPTTAVKRNPAEALHSGLRGGYALLPARPSDHGISTVVEGEMAVRVAHARHQRLSRAVDQFDVLGVREMPRSLRDSLDSVTAYQNFGGNRSRRIPSKTRTFVKESHFEPYLPRILTLVMEVATRFASCAPSFDRHTLPMRTLNVYTYVDKIVRRT